MRSMLVMSGVPRGCSYESIDTVRGEYTPVRTLTPCPGSSLMIAAGCDCDLSGGVDIAQVGGDQSNVLLVDAADGCAAGAKKSFIEGEEGSRGAVSRSLENAVAEVKTDLGSCEVSGEG